MKVELGSKPRNIVDWVHDARLALRHLFATKRTSRRDGNTVLVISRLQCWDLWQARRTGTIYSSDYPRDPSRHDRHHSISRQLFYESFPQTWFDRLQRPDPSAQVAPQRGAARSITRLAETKLETIRWVHLQEMPRRANTGILMRSRLAPNAIAAAHSHAPRPVLFCSLRLVWCGSEVLGLAFREAHQEAIMAGKCNCLVNNARREKAEWREPLQKIGRCLFWMKPNSVLVHSLLNSAHSSRFGPRGIRLVDAKRTCIMKTSMLPINSLAWRFELDWEGGREVWAATHFAPAICRAEPY